MNGLSRIRGDARVELRESSCSLHDILMWMIVFLRMLGQNMEQKDEWYSTDEQSILVLGP